MAAAFADFSFADTAFQARIEFEENRYIVTCDSEPTELQIMHEGDGQLIVIKDDHRQTMWFCQSGNSVTLFSSHQTFNFVITSPLDDAGQSAPSDDKISAPMPGLVKVVAVEAGAEVGEGQQLVVLEAMKMEHSLSAPMAAVVRRGFCSRR